MCVAILKPAGAECPSMSVLSDCWDANKDGAGVAVSESGGVYIRKGFMTFGEFEAWFRKAKIARRTSQAVVFHFRIGTHGANDAGNTHPFPVSASPEVLRRLSGRFKEAVAHNGVFKNTVTLPDVSDTGQFIADCAKAGGDPVKFWDDNKAVAGWSRLVVLKPNNKYVLRGDWHCVEGSGCMFSNLGWTHKAVKYTPLAKYTPPAGNRVSGFGWNDLDYDCGEGGWSPTPARKDPPKNDPPKHVFYLPEKSTGMADKVIRGVRYRASRDADWSLGGWTACAKCAVQTDNDEGRKGLCCGDFGSACASDKTLYWERVPEGKPAEPKKAAEPGYPEQIRLIKITKTDRASGKQYVSYVKDESPAPVKGPEATLAAAKAAMDGFGAPWSPG